MALLNVALLILVISRSLAVLGMMYPATALYYSSLWNCFFHKERQKLQRFSN